MIHEALDINLIAVVINSITMLGNLYWVVRLSAVKGNSELVNYWEEECKKKDYQLEQLTIHIRELDKRLVEMVRKKNELKEQYKHVAALNRGLEGQLIVFKQAKIG